VLIAEDNAINQRVAAAMVEHLGFGADVVSDGRGAVTAAAQLPYRAILMDCQLPILDGFQATAEIRALEGSARHTPIIAVTASASESDQRRCLAAGMDDYLAKPLSLNVLATLLARWAPEGTFDAPPPVPPGVVLPPPPAEPGPALLDQLVIERLEHLGAATGQDLLGQLVQLFVSDADTRFLALSQALTDQAAAAVVRTAHAMSGSSANLGATDLARLCATLATDSAANDPVLSQALLAGIEAELGRVRSALGLLVSTA
jgi:two-component system, sensor histidine kinase and response regulator